MDYTFSYCSNQFICAFSHLSVHDHTKFRGGNFKYYVTRSHTKAAIEGSWRTEAFCPTPIATSYSAWSVAGVLEKVDGGHGAAVVARPPPTSEIRVRVPDWARVGKLVTLLAAGHQFTVQNLDQLYVLVSSALPTTLHNTTNKVPGVT